MKRQVKNNARTKQSACRGEIPGKKSDGDFPAANELCDETVSDSVDHCYCADFVSVLANVQGTMFMQTLIDDYIMPMLGQDNPDFGPLAMGDPAGGRILSARSSGYVFL